VWGKGGGPVGIEKEILEEKRGASGISKILGSLERQKVGLREMGGSSTRKKGQRTKKRESPAPLVLKWGAPATWLVFSEKKSLVSGAEDCSGKERALSTKRTSGEKKRELPHHDLPRGGSVGTSQEKLPVSSVTQQKERDTKGRRGVTFTLPTLKKGLYPVVH